MTGLGTRQIRPRPPSAPSSPTRANPCVGSSQTRHSTSHSASVSERSPGVVMAKGYEGPGAAGQQAE